MSRILNLILILILAVPALSSAGWRDVLDGAEKVDKLIVNRPAPSEPEPTESNNEAPPPEQIPGSAQQGREDNHFIQPDDYFVSKEELGSNSYIYVLLSKMVTRPSSGTKDEGEFMKIHDGQNVWTSNIWQSRISSKSELRLGMYMIAFNDNHQNGVYQAPKKKDTARGGSWFYAKITDISDMYKGYVTVSGNYKVGIHNIRIPIPYASQGR